MRTQAPFRISPDDRIRTIRHSLLCFGFGAASLVPLFCFPPTLLLIVNVSASNRFVAVALTIWIPLLSLAFALVAAVNFHRARKVANGEWNPARVQLVWGRILSSLGILCSLPQLAFFAAVLLKLLPGQEGQ